MCTCTRVPTQSQLFVHPSTFLKRGFGRGFGFRTDFSMEAAASIGHGMDDPRLIIDYHKDGVNVIIDYNGTQSLLH